MADFKVEVPITLKGGNEGNKVGTQIGEKIAAQLNKSLKAIGIGKTGDSPAGTLGVTKGLGSVATKLGVVGVAIAAAVKFLSKASPYLKGILDIFGRSFMIFFRPFGDFLATLLRPMAILMMKAAVAFLKFSKTPAGKKVVAGMSGAVAGAVVGAGVGMLGGPIGAAGGAVIGAAVALVGKEIFNFGFKLAEGVHMIGKGLVQLGYNIAEWIHTKVIIPAGEFLAEKLTIAWEVIKSPFQALADFIQKIADWIKKIIPGGDGGGSPGRASNTIYSGGTGGAGVPSGLPGNRKDYVSESIVSNVGDVVKKGFTNLVGSFFKSAIMRVLPILGKGQVGIPNVQKDGLYQLHRGESVVSRSKTGQSTILNPTFNFTGNISSEIDIDELMRRANRMNEMELKQRGVI